MRANYSILWDILEKLYEISKANPSTFIHVHMYPLSSNLGSVSGYTASKVCVVGFTYLSYDVASGSEITPCNKIDKPLVDYRFTGNVMTSIKSFVHSVKSLTFLRQM